MNATSFPGISFVRRFNSRHNNQTLAPNRPTMSKTYFIISSPGRSATQWTAAAFNKHPDVCLIHGPDTAAQPNCHEPWKERYLRTYRGIPEFERLSTDDFFDRVEQKNPNKLSYGNINGKLAYQIPTQTARTYRVLHLARHPINRIESNIKHWSEVIYDFECHQQLSFLQQRLAAHINDPFLRQLINQHNVDISQKRNWLFIVSVFYLEFDKAHFALPIQHAPMERLTGEPDYFLWFFRRLTGSEVRVDKQFIEEVFSLKPVDRKSTGRIVENTFSAWEPWKKRLFEHFVSQNGLPKYYDALGYNVKF